MTLPRKVTSTAPKPQTTKKINVSVDSNSSGFKGFPTPPLKPSKAPTLSSLAASIAKLQEENGALRLRIAELETSREDSDKALEESFTELSNPDKASVPPKVITEPPQPQALNTNTDQLLTIIINLQTTVINLEKKLELVVESIKTIQTSKSRDALGERPPKKSKSEPPSDKVVTPSRTFAISGIQISSTIAPDKAAEKILKTLDDKFIITADTKIKTLPQKPEATYATVLVSAKADSVTCETLTKAKKGNFTGKDVGLEGDLVIHINESHPQPLYQFYKKSRALKQKGFQFVWIQKGRVLARRSSGDKIIHIKDASHLDTLLQTNHIHQDNEHSD